MMSHIPFLHQFEAVPLASRGQGITRRSLSGDIHQVMTATMAVEIFAILQSRCFQAILWISRYGVCIFIRFLFLRVPHTPLHHKHDQFTTEDD
ncbi:hypothetical protein PISMIDRAFT_478585 [Pisolithus microcarpus 441]|uniref:Uncharacterized protein n=1 Tax=Pisolithus microcarpus 441 TaxID=765257 RepID=A0A0C9XH50_9AGAM|nr:hypothetical protein PISMIDRAFT_478585 [Pisolithus microcarpus 441]